MCEGRSTEIVLHGRYFFQDVSDEAVEFMVNLLSCLLLATRRRVIALCMFSRILKLVPVTASDRYQNGQ